MTIERPAHPGTILKERFLDPLGITPYRLAKFIGVGVRRVSELVKGNRRLTPDTAIRLGLFFGVPAIWWLEMQSRYDTEGVALVDELRGRVLPYEGLDNVLVTPNGVKFREQPGDTSQSPELVEVPDELIARLRAQVAHSPRPMRRQTRTVTYTNGATALVGSDG